MELLSTNSLTILAGTGLFFVLAMLLVIVLLVAKKYLVPSGNVKITINDKDTVSTTSGNSLLSTLANDCLLYTSPSPRDCS